MITPHRPIHEIATEIQRNWPKPYFGAVPYISAMYGLTRITDTYGPAQEPASGIILYFLANASTWKGETARKIKAELNAIIKANRNR